jgi:N6-adenosine-specific RNA methylase IME4
MLAEARSLDDLRHVRDVAVAAAQYARARDLGLEAVRYATAIAAKATRRIGELAPPVPPEERWKGRGDTFGSPKVSLPYPRLSEARLLAEVLTDDEIDELVGRMDRPSLDRILRLARSRRVPEPVREPVPLPPGRYRCIVIDPPWPVTKILRDVRPNQDAGLDYPTMSLDAIAELPIADLTDPAGAHVYLWTTHRFLPAAFGLFERWGVDYECVMTWVKNVGMTPYSWMYDTEHVLFGRVGSLPLQRLGLRLSFAAPVTRHSEKPDIFYERVAEASPGPRLDMFARRPRDGFEVWGNEVADAS